MFRENEPGKPKNWTCTIAVIALTTAINIAIFIVCRVLLDSEDSNNEPLLQGKLRDNITFFLGIFSMTFCFGCCCCFCCGCEVFRWMFRMRCKRFDLSKLWSGALKNKFSNSIAEPGLQQICINSIPRFSIHSLPPEREEFFYANPSFNPGPQESAAFVFPQTLANNSQVSLSETVKIPNGDQR